MITEKRISVVQCAEGIYLRWYFNGWHYFNFSNGCQINMNNEDSDIQVSQFYSVISKIERPTKVKSEFSYSLTLEGISPDDIEGFEGLLIAEKVEQYDNEIWSEVDITRTNTTVKSGNEPYYRISFEITRKDLSGTSSNYQISQHLYVGDTECDLDDDEVIALTRQANDIAEMQDRQSDFTAGFKIRKTRAMRELFELAGEIGSNTNLPYTKMGCRYVNEGIEVISSGYLIINRSDFYYYYCSIYFGNLNFFKNIEGLTLNDLTLSGCNHTWNVATMVASHTSSPLPDYIYPLLEPSDDAAMNPLTDDGSRTELYGGWVWPFVKCLPIFNEIISNADFTPEGNILTDSVFAKMAMPISDREIASTFAYRFYYGLYNNNTYNFPSALNQLPGGSLITGDDNFKDYGIYTTHFGADYKFKIELLTSYLLSAPDVYLNDPSASPSNIAFSKITERQFGFTKIIEYEIEYTSDSGIDLTFLVSSCLLYYYSIQVSDIQNTAIGYGSEFSSTVKISNFLPDISQTEYIKMICNFFGLIPDADSRTGKILFWNYSMLYDNIPQARDWSAYLSESDDENEFQFGDYAQNNYMRFEGSDDVKEDTGLGNMQIADETLEEKKDVIDVPVSTTDEVTILTDVNVSRIAMNTYNDPDYDQEDSIDPRMVMIEQLDSKTFGIRPAVAAGSATDISDPYKARAMKFGDTIMNYTSLARMLYKSQIIKARINLPVYEFAGFKHYIPIYFNQYQAYFYVNKIENYVAGKLCTIELIKL